MKQCEDCKMMFTDIQIEQSIITDGHYCKKDDDICMSRLVEIKEELHDKD